MKKGTKHLEETKIRLAEAKQSKMKKQILFSIILLTLILPIITAQETPLTFQFNKQFDLKQPCSDRGFFCAANFECNITLINPEGDVIIS
ncbi:hypothetical protein LCGC14_2542870, partial [marine sediment metagenome]